MTNKLYDRRDIEGQEQYYLDHIMAMTGEDLHSKSDIAAELAHRDIEIDKLKEEVQKLKDGDGEYSMKFFNRMNKDEDRR